MNKALQQEAAALRLAGVNGGAGSRSRKNELRSGEGAARAGSGAAGEAGTGLALSWGSNQRVHTIALIPHVSAGGDASAGVLGGCSC